jgi:hypothetical protein
MDSLAEFSHFLHQNFWGIIFLSGNEPKSRKLVRRAPSKIEQADCPSKSEKNILELDKQ